jgi:hypothetical protein
MRQGKSPQKACEEAGQVYATEPKISIFSLFILNSKRPDLYQTYAVVLITWYMSDAW